jgi:hypothetical protein
MVHLKTAGTSYVEALRIVAMTDPALFRQILAFAQAHYAVDRASYHVSAEAARVPDFDRLPDDALASLLDEHNTRQVLHVTFGSTLTSFGIDIKATLLTHAAAYGELLEAHLARHLLPFAPRSSGGRRAGNN